jgi:large subunit ribosomal protein L18
MPGLKTKEDARLKRKQRIRKRITGTPERPRLSVYRSLNHIYAQAIDDVQARSLAQVSSRSKEVQEKLEGKNNKTGVSKIVGMVIADKLMALGIKKIVFDRGGYRYHGRVKAVADGAREKGLEF